MRCGTPGFVAPEVVNIRDMKAKYDPICDVFSAGLIFYLLLSGKPAFPGKTYNEVLQKNRECNINFGIPELLRVSKHPYSLLKRMLEKDPCKRISAEEAVNHAFFHSANDKNADSENIQDG